MMTRSRLSVAALLIASAASIATSTEDPAPPPPPGATSAASSEGVVSVAPGATVRRTIQVGVELNDMPQITSSWVTLYVDGQTSSGSATIRASVAGFAQANQSTFTVGSSGLTSREFSVNGVDTGCLGQGDLCWSTWHIDITHTGGTGSALVDYRFEAAVDGVVTPLYLDPQ